MMLVKNQIVEISWTPATKEWYESKGYEFTGYRKKFKVKAEDLQNGSGLKVRVICEYCGKEFITKYSLYICGLETGKSCCQTCRKLKYKDSCLKKYGVENGFQLDFVKEKIKQASLEKYGTERPCQSQKVKEKIENTNIAKYGCKMTLQNPEILSKAKQTCMEKYGVENVFQSQEIQDKIKEINRQKYGEGNIAHTPLIAEKIRQNNLEKYGVPYVFQAESVITKIRQSLYENGTVPTSKPENAVCDLLEEIYGTNNCQRGFPLDKITMDCMLKIGDIKIDVEYDGLYYHADRKEKDKRRNYFVIKKGYKVIRIKGNKKDTLPTKEQIIKAVDCLVKGNQHFIEIDMNI